METNTTETRNPQQLLAEQQVQNEAKAAALKAKKEAAGVLHFVHGGRVFKPLIPAVFIPGLGRRSALELCTDKAAQDYLIKEGCVRSVIEEV